MSVPHNSKYRGMTYRAYNSKQVGEERIPGFRVEKVGKR